MNDLEKKYIELLEEVLNSYNISNIDNEIEDSNLLFGKSSKTKISKIKSNYVHILNKIELDLLTEEEKYNINNLKTIEEKKDYIKKTISKVTNNNYIIEPVILNKKVPKNTLVLEILIGANKSKLNEINFINNMKLQEKYLKELKKKYTRELTKKLNYPVIIYIDKEI